MGVSLTAVAAILVAGSGFALAATLHLQRLPQLVLAAYVLAFAEIVALMFVLSAFGALTRVRILVGVAALFAVSATRWFLLGAPRPHPWPQYLHYVRALWRDHLLLVLTVAAGLALLYVLALIVGTPPNSYDSLTYHLARAAFWRQEGGVGYVSNAYDERLNVNPPNAEIVVTFLLEIGRNERLAGFVQFTAALALSLGSYALARRLNIGRREAAFGALLFLILPIVLLQASTALNDLVAASFLIAATVFLIGDSRRELALAALATALAVGTKIPAAYGLTVLGALAFVAPPSAYRMQRFFALIAGAGVGSYWYVVNMVRTGRPLGDLPDEATGLVAILEPAENFFGSYARLMDSFDLSGALGPDVLVYVFVGAAIAAALLIAGRYDAKGKVLPAVVTGSLIAFPLIFIPVSFAVRSAFDKLDGPEALEDRFLSLRGWSKTVASDTVSWFGPLGLPLVVGVAAAAVILVRRGALPSVALVLAAAPLAWFVLLSLSLGYDITQGRFFVYPVALSASLWGLLLRVDRYAIAAVAVASTTAALSLAHFEEKPSGLRLLERDVPATIWGASRWEVQSTTRLEKRTSLRFLADLPPGATIALAIGYNDFGYPAFGPSLERHVDLVPLGSNARASRSDWLLANPERASEIDRMCWTVVLTTLEGWTGFRRNTDCRT